MSRLGGRRAGAGRKKTLKSEIIENLRGRITDEDFELALETLRYAMNNRKKNLKTAVTAAIYVADQKIGRAPQPIVGDKGGPVLVRFVENVPE